MTFILDFLTNTFTGIGLASTITEIEFGVEKGNFEPKSGKQKCLEGYDFHP